MNGTKRSGTTVLSLVIITSIVMLLVFVAMFMIGLGQYSDATADKISAYTNDARWDERHAVIVMGDSLIFLALGLVFMVLALALHEKSQNER